GLVVVTQAHPEAARGDAGEGTVVVAQLGADGVTADHQPEVPGQGGVDMRLEAAEAAVGGLEGDDREVRLLVTLAGLEGEDVIVDAVEEDGTVRNQAGRVVAEGKVGPVRDLRRERGIADL